MELKVSNVFARNYESKKRIVVNQGGTRSSKTYSICQILVLWLLTGNFKGQILQGNITVVRKTLPALKRSVLLDFKEVCSSFGMFQLDGFRENKSDLFFSYQNRVDLLFQQTTPKS